MRILLVEPYFGGSHQAWAEGYRDASSHEVRLLTMPARWWKWRMRGGMVSLAEEAAQLARDGYRPDLILTTDMIDLAAFKGLLPWSGIPTVIFFHESQLTYPDSPLAEPDLSYAVTNWTSAHTADAVIFNSEFHRRVFFEGLPRLLRHFPDFTHESLIPSVVVKASVVPVGVDLRWVAPRQETDRLPLVIWNHRWEHDKEPAVFLEAIETIDGCRVALCGESFGNGDARFEEARVRLGGRLVQFGYAPLDGYRGLLNRADVVVSTARQEFFGVAVVEAMAAGAFPVLPDRLSYPELIPAEVHGEVLYSEGGFKAALQRAIEDAKLRSGVTALTAPAMKAFSWDRVAPRMDALLEAI